MKRLIIPIVASTFVFAAAGTFAHEPTQIELQSQATVSEADARVTALAKVPTGTIAESELEREHHRLIWSFDIAQAGSKDIIEIQVDAKTGKIVSKTTETPGKEAKEAVAESKEKTK
jgi:uncharacterized membrane protein YkoI